MARFAARPRTIVSGGQTGADRAALDFALRFGFAHAGWCPQGRLAEDGVIPQRYLLRETPTSEYLQRTRLNVRDSDATVIISITRQLTGGSQATAEFARALGRPLLCLSRNAGRNEVATQLVSFVEEYAISVLNVAGPRASDEPGIESFVYAVLVRAFSGKADLPQADS